MKHHRSYAHARISGILNSLVGTYNTTFGLDHSEDNIISLDGSTTYYIGNSVIEADCSFFNNFIPNTIAFQDSNDNTLPTIVIEVNKSQPYRSVYEKVPIYFSVEQIRVVIIIHLICSPNNIVTQMVAVVYRKSINLQNAAFAISFGSELHSSTAAAIKRHSHVEEKLIYMYRSW